MSDSKNAEISRTKRLLVSRFQLFVVLLYSERVDLF